MSSSSDPPERSVHFAAHASVKKIPHLIDMPDKVHRRIYWNDEEMLAVRLDCHEKVKQMDENPSSEFDFHTRGLVYYTQEYSEKVAVTRKKLYLLANVVKEYQQESGRDTTRLLAKVLNDVSSESKKAAFRLAREDARVAGIIHDRQDLARSQKKKKLATSLNKAKSKTTMDKSYEVQRELPHSLVEKLSPLLSSKRAVSGNCKDFLQAALTLTTEEEGSDSDINSVEADQVCVVAQ